jgi:hypothetical protein
VSEELYQHHFEELLEGLQQQLLAQHDMSEETLQVSSGFGLRP